MGQKQTEQRKRLHDGAVRISGLRLPGTRRISLLVPRDVAGFNALFEIWFSRSYGGLQLQPGMVVLDAGANAGLFTIMASKLIGDSGLVVSYEPSEFYLEVLRENIRINHTNNVVIVPRALSNSSEPILLHEKDGFYSDLQDSQGGRTVELEATTLDDSMRELGIHSADALKMDIEGGEVRALQGGTATLAQVKHAVVETHSPELNDTSVRLLRNLGFIVDSTSLMDCTRRHLASSFAQNWKGLIELEMLRTLAWRQTAQPSLCPLWVRPLRRLKPAGQMFDSVADLLAPRLLVAHRPGSGRPLGSAWRGV